MPKIIVGALIIGIILVARFASHATTGNDSEVFRPSMNPSPSNSSRQVSVEKDPIDNDIGSRYVDQPNDPTSLPSIGSRYVDQPNDPTSLPSIGSRYVDSMSSTSQKIGGFTYTNGQVGNDSMSSTSQTIGGFTYTNGQVGNRSYSCTSQTIGSFTYTNCP